MEASRAKHWRNRLPGRERVGYWGRELGRFFSLQVGISLLNLVAGLLIVRALSKAEYAYYTVGFIAMSISTNISSAGVAPAVNKLAGRCWQSPTLMGEVINTAISFRKIVAIGFAIPIAAYAIWQFRLLDAGWALALALTAIFSVGALVEVETSILRVPLIFAKEIKRLQVLDLWTGVSKLLLVALIGFLAPSAFAIAAVSIAAIVLYWGLLRSTASEFADRTAPVKQEIRREIIALFKPNIASVIYYSFQGQIIILIAAVVGTTANVAELGALGKLAVVFAIIASFIGSYVHPAVAKENSPRGILKKSGVIFGILSFVCVGALLLSAVAPDLCLMALGDKYEGLREVLSLYVAVALLGIVQAEFQGLCVVRGWVRLYAWFVPVALVTQVLGLVVLPLESVRDILVYQGLTNAVTLLYAAGVFFYEYVQYSKNYTPITDQVYIKA